MSSNLPPNMNEDNEVFNQAHVPTRECSWCMGCGIEAELKLVDGEYKKLWHDCTECNGTGKVEMTAEEIRKERESKVESKYDL